MKFASDFKREAKAALRGKWLLASVTAFVASLIGAQLTGTGVGFNFNGSDATPEAVTGSFINPSMIASIIASTFMFASVYTIILIIIGGAATLGYARFNLNIVDGKDAKLSDLFSQFHRLGSGFLMNLLMSLYIILWSLLFIIPGIVKAFSYSMTPYILYEHPEYTPDQAITESRKMMNGNKFRLFCLHFSFIGWGFLCALPTTIAGAALAFGNPLLLPLILVSTAGSFVLAAYTEAAQTAFYREISKAADSVQIPAAESSQTSV